MQDDVLSHHLFDPDGDVRQMIERVAEKWTVLIITALSPAGKRPGELRRLIPGISEKMLTHTLRKLEQAELVQRTVHSMVPPHIVYTLTPNGHALARVLLKIQAWSTAYQNEHLSQPDAEGSPTNSGSQEIFARIAEKWTVFILYRLARGTKRYNELRRAVGHPSQKMLTQTLRRLAHDGLIARLEFPETPPRVEYSLTPAGKALASILSELCLWAEASRHAP